MPACVRTIPAHANTQRLYSPHRIPAMSERQSRRGMRSTVEGEARMGAELARLVADPIFYGAGVPRGDGRPVLVLPGLFGNDLYLGPLHGWLLRIGYRPVISTISLNAGCSDRLRERARAALQSAAGDARKVAIIGHSRGGMLGWSIAAELGERATHLCLLGSPAGALARMLQAGRFDIHAVPANTAVVNAGRAAQRVLSPRCDFPACGCAYVQALAKGLSASTKVLSVYSSEDQIVPPSACPVPGATNVEVTGSHSGLAQNVAVYRALGKFLAA